MSTPLLPKKAAWRKEYESRSRSRKSSRQSTRTRPKNKSYNRKLRQDDEQFARENSHSPSSRASIASRLTTYSVCESSILSIPKRSQDQSEVSPESADWTQPHKDSEIAEEVVMAIDIRSRDTVGCCYYVAFEEKLYILSDVKFGGLETVETLKCTLEPTTILLPAQVNEKVDKILDTNSSLGDGPSVDDQFRLPYAVEMRSTKEFSFDEAVRKLSELHVLGVQSQDIDMASPGDDDPSENCDAEPGTGFTRRNARSLRLAALIDLNSQLSIGCASAILQWIQRRRVQLFFPGDPGAKFMFRINSLEMFSPSQTMYMSPDTLAALQITEYETHPHMQNQGPNAYGSKESLSVYGLFHHLATSPQGRQRLRKVFLRPSLDIREISERHNSISAFLQTANDDVREVMVKSLKSIRNMRPVLLHLRKGMSGTNNGANKIGSGVWMTIRSFAFHALEILTAMRQLVYTEHLEIKSKVLEVFNPRQVALIGRDITTVVDFKASFEENRTIINSGVDENLDAIKRTYAGIDDLLSDLSNVIVKEFHARQGEFFINVVTYPQIGFLIALQKEQSSGQFPHPPELSKGQRWEHIFSTEEAAYYKDSRMHALDGQFGDIASLIYDREIEVTFRLGQRILEHEDLLCQISDVCGELDVLLALARGAKIYHLSRPQMTTRNVIDIESGRHILQEQVTRNFVPNNTHIAGREEDTDEEATQPPQTGLPIDRTPAPSMLILTGPNYSGKSVYLKQTALIVFLAHIGSFVPANEATIGLTDKIMTRVSTRETISREHSAFMIDLQQIASAINIATDRSLVIIDEFGKGTDSDDGAGLMSAVLNYFISNEKTRPKVLAATHFHEIFENSLLRADKYSAFAHMAVMVKKVERLEDQVTFLYELRPGRSVASYGTVCAAMNGISATIVERATAIIRRRAQGDLLAIQDSPTQAEKEKLVEVVSEELTTFGIKPPI